VTDQAELHSLIAKVRDLGAPLLSVKIIDAPGRAAGLPETGRQQHRNHEDPRGL
jgi:hypothetical protein